MAADGRSLGQGYSLRLLLRHIPLSLYRMRSVVAEMRDVRAGWGACLAIFFCSTAVLCAETVLRDVLTAEPGFEALRAQWGEPLFRAVAVGCLATAMAIVTLLAVVAFWATSRLFRARIGLADSAIGVFASLLPQVAFSVTIIIIAAILSVSVTTETRLEWLVICDYVVIVAMLGYGVVSYSAATGLGLMATFAVQVIGVCGAVVLLSGGLALAALATDYGLSWVVQLVLGA